MDDEKRTTYEAETSQEMMEAKSETGEQTAQAAFSGYEVEFTTLVMIYVGYDFGHENPTRIDLCTDV